MIDWNQSVSWLIVYQAGRRCLVGVTGGKRHLGICCPFLTVTDYSEIIDNRLEAADDAQSNLEWSRACRERSLRSG